MNDFILICVLITATTQRSQSLLSLFLFSLLCLSYDAFESFIKNNYFYYIAAAFVDLLIIKILSKVLNPNNTNLLLQKICIFFICINLAGYLIYYLDLPAVIYSFISSVLYMTVLIIAIFKDLDYGRFGNNWWNFGVYRNANQSYQLSHSVQTPRAGHGAIQ